MLQNLSSAAVVIGRDWRFKVQHVNEYVHSLYT